MRNGQITDGWLRVATLLGALLLGGCATTTTVFRDGQVLLPVLVAAEATSEEHLAAAELGRVLGKMSGLSWPVRPPARPEERGFYVGKFVYAVGHLKPLQPAKDIFSRKPGEVGPDGFRIETQNGSVFLAGASPETAASAVFWLLQHEGGVRWYAPGETGEIIPRRSQWTLPQLHIVREPAYVSREITGLQTTEETIWAWHNGLRSRLEFSHALGNVFVPAIERHSDWLSLVEGKPYQPGAANDQNWQPNLALPAVAEHASQAAVSAFANDPGRKSFSLGMNDTVRFDQSTATQAVVEPLRYFRGRPDYSPLVFGFMNRAAGSISAHYPDRYLGCLAYFWCENPPPFPVHPQVVPFVTTDRTQYYDRDYREADFALMSRWGATGVKAFGLWEYAYGRGFLVPRLPVNALAEGVREGWHRGARGYLAEVEPHWGFDAFKVWMLAQLLWEPDRPVAELSGDFYAGYYGAAALPMRRFFERCETQWLQQQGHPFWLKLYQQEDQALLFPPEVCRELRGLLDQAAHAAAADSMVAARVERTSRAFAVTEAYVRFDAVRRRLAAENPGRLVIDETMLARGIAEMVEAEAKLQETLAAACSGTVPALAASDISALVRNDPVPRLLWLAGQRDAAAPTRVLQVVGQAALRRVPWTTLAKLWESGQVSTAPNLVANSSFTEAADAFLEPRFLHPLTGKLPAKWQVSAMPTETGKLELLSVRSGETHGSVRIEGAWDTQLYQWIPVEPGCAYVATARLRGQTSPGNDSALFLTFLDAVGQVCGPVRMQSLVKGSTSEFQIFALADRTPEQAAWIGVGIGCTRQCPGDWAEVSEVELRGVITEETP